MQTSGSRTLIIIPALNEEESLPRVLADIGVTLPGYDVLVVDDGSTDATAEVARRGGATVLPLPFNLGVGGALRTGFRYAVREGYTRAVQVDADGQHDVSEVAKLLAALEGGANLVVGSRFADGSRAYQVGRTRSGAMGLLRLLVRGLAGTRITDASSGFRAFDEAAIHLFAETYPLEYLSDSVEALLLAAYAGLEVREVGVRMRERTGGVPSTRNVRLVYHYLRLLMVVAFTASRRRTDHAEPDHAVADNAAPDSTQPDSTQPASAAPSRGNDPAERSTP